MRTYRRTAILAVVLLSLSVITIGQQTPNYPLPQEADYVIKDFKLIEAGTEPNHPKCQDTTEDEAAVGHARPLRRRRVEPCCSWRDHLASTWDCSRGGH